MRVWRLADGPLLPSPSGVGVGGEGRRDATAYVVASLPIALARFADELVWRDHAALDVPDHVFQLQSNVGLHEDVDAERWQLAGRPSVADARITVRYGSVRPHGWHSSRRGDQWIALDWGR